MLASSGGIENPLFIAYLFHVIIPGILLPQKQAFTLTLVACVLFSALALGEDSHVLPHYTIVIFPHVQQREGDENTNRLLRQYLSKQSDLSEYSQAELNKIALRLNQRPRKTLGFRCPADTLDDLLR